MDVTQLEARLQQVLQLNEELRVQNASLVQTVTQLRHDHEALLASTQAVKEDRDKLQQRVAELEAANRRLVDMLWGRRTERRTISPDQLCLDFGSDADGSLSEDEQAVITAAEQAEEEFDEDLLRRLQLQRPRRKEGQRRTQEFPPDLERRERVFDLSDEEKAGLKYIGDAVSERMRFEKPHVYIERIVRRKYVVPLQPERGVLSPPPPLAILEGCKYDFSVVAAIVAGKFAFHNPTYRQQDWFAQSGWFPNRSTINDLINASVDTTVPLFEQMWHLLLQPSILLSDDTRVLLLTRNALALRQRDAVPVWERFGVWLASEKVQRALPQSRFGQAVGYLQNQWTSLQRYLVDGRIPIDNNQSEQIIRPLTTGRKNWRAPDVPRRTSGRSKARDALLAMFERTVAVRSAICI